MEEWHSPLSYHAKTQNANLQRAGSCEYAGRGEESSPLQRSVFGHQHRYLAHNLSHAVEGKTSFASVQFRS